MKQTDGKHWYFEASLCYRGSKTNQMTSTSLWCDLAVFKLEHAIEPVLIRFPAPNENYVNPCFNLRHRRVSEWDKSISIDDIEYFTDTMIPAVVADTNVKLHLGQAVCLVGFPELKELQVRYGNILEFDGWDVNLNISTTAGASGGPIYDVNGNVVGILSRYKENKSYAIKICFEDVSASHEFLSSHDSCVLP